MIPDAPRLLTHLVDVDQTDAPASDPQFVLGLDGGVWKRSTVTGGGGGGGGIVVGGLVTLDPGTVAYDDTGDDLEVDVTASKWGIDGDGPYFDDAGVTSGDEALLCVDSASGELVVVPWRRD